MDKDKYSADIKEAASYIEQKADLVPQLGLVLGSGLADLADQVQDALVLPFAKIPGFARSSVQGHRGQLLLGYWQELPILVLSGRLHYYEGHSMADVVFPIRVMQELGIKHLILTNAAGGVDESFVPGDLMLIKDHISLFAESPLRGANLDQYGPRFPDQSQIYDPAWLNLAQKIAATQSIRLHSGVYAWCRGPQYETPTEIRLMRQLGAAAVGMSTVPEAITASHGGMKVLGLSCITNMAAGILAQPLNHEDVMLVGQQAASRTIQLLAALLAELQKSLAEENL